MRQTIDHPLEPVVFPDARILILGTMPSVKSRENGFYYTHPQNRFWRVMAAVAGVPVPLDNAQRLAFCRAHHLALWDVLRRCDIEGSDDGSIRAPVANDLSVVFNQADIKAVFTTGTRAFQLYRRLCRSLTGREAVPLPSPSPANCRYFTFASLVERYKILRPYMADDDR